MRLQRVSCRNPRHPAGCMRSVPCLFSNPPEFQRACPVPFRVGDARCFSAPVLFRRSPRRSRRDDSLCGGGFASAAVSSPGLTAVTSGFPLAGNDGNPANVNDYYWSATTNNNNNAFYMSVTPTGSSVTNNNKTNLYSVRCVRSVCARTGKPSF